MAFKVVAFLVFFFLITAAQEFSSSTATNVDASSTAPAPAPAPAPARSPIVDVSECPRLCIDRCAASSRQKLCRRACQACCQRCKCVPPGTSGNREMCGECYANMKTHGGRLKCP